MPEHVLLPVESLTVSILQMPCFGERKPVATTESELAFPGRQTKSFDVNTVRLSAEYKYKFIFATELNPVWTIPSKVAASRPHSRLPRCLPSLPLDSSERKGGPSNGKVTRDDRSFVANQTHHSTAEKIVIVVECISRKSERFAAQGVDEGFTFRL
jgi:hypothetical protein